MKSVMRHLFVLSMAFVIAGIANAQEAKPKPKGKGGAAGRALAAFQLPRTLKLTDEQKTKVNEIKKGMREKAQAAQKKLNELMTPERRKAMAAARKKAREDGVKGKQLQEALVTALKLSDDEKEKYKAAQAEVNKVRMAFRAKVREILDDEQKKLLRGPGRKKKDS